MNSTGLATPTVALRLLRLLPGSLRSQSGGGSTCGSCWRLSPRSWAVDPEKGTIVLGEVGRWHVKDGQTEITLRTIDVEPAVKGGDFVTVRVEQMGKRPIATRIAVTVTAE